MPRLDDYQDIAVEYASRASSLMRTSLHVAFVYGRGGILLAMSTNRLGTRSRGAGFSRYTIHAERAALKAVGDVSLLRGAVLVVVRVSKNGELLYSEPCYECRPHLEKAMDKYGLRRVYYSPHPEGEWTHEKPDPKVRRIPLGMRPPRDPSPKTAPTPRCHHCHH